MPSRKEKLKQLKTALQHKLKAEAFVENSIQPFTEILVLLEQRKIAYALCDLIIPDKTLLLPHLSEALKEPVFQPLLAHAGNTDAAKNLHNLFERYPSTNALRYVPPVQKLKVPSILKDAIDFLELQNQPVSIYYLRYAPLLKVQLYDLVFDDEDKLFNFWHGDVVIFPENLNWLIAFSLEEEWYAGRLNP
ncbi:MAG TPA: hypothetical protein VFM65_05750 [Flavobacteriaceae bacterium]|nr:hypothetical protein [Flavobacteriaceae bacterium]